MKTLFPHIIPATLRRRRRRGTVMLLVIGVLTLLAVLGTAYIVAARTERTTSRAVSEAINIDLARDAIISQAISCMFQATQGPADGIMSGGAPDAALLTLPDPWRPNQSYSPGQVVMGGDGMVYMCRTGHTSDFSAANGPPPSLNSSPNWGALATWSANIQYRQWDTVVGTDGKWYSSYKAQSAGSVNLSAPPKSMLAWTSLSMPNGIVGLNTLATLPRYFDYPESHGLLWTNGVQLPPGQAKGRRLQGHGRDNWAVPDQNWLSRDIYAWPYVDPNWPPGTSPRSLDYCEFTYSKFDRNTGLCTAPMPVADQQQPEAATINVIDPTSSTVLDGVWHVLPFSTAAGVRIRFAPRIIDTSRFLNLNVGSPSATVTDAYGQYLTSLALATASAFGGDPKGTPDTPTAIHDGTASIVGRKGTGPAFGLKSWQDRVMALERCGLNTVAGTPADMQSFDLADELELRANGTRGGGSICRPALLWPNTLAAAGMNSSTDPTNPKFQRRLFTTYSTDRNTGQVTSSSAANSLNHPRFTFAYGPGYTWPGDQKRVNLNAVTSVLPDDLIRNAAYVANMMAAAGYPDDEALATALNYISQGCNKGGVTAQGSVLVPNGQGWSLVLAAPNAPPTYIVPITVTGTAGNAVGKTLMAYSAQPFLNETAINVATPPLSGPPQLQEFTLELYQPYAKPLTQAYLRDWQLTIGDKDKPSSAVVWVSDLGSTLGSFPQGFALIDATTPSKLMPPAGLDPPPARKTVPLPASVDPRGKTVYLQRPYYDANNNKHYMVVDYITIPANPDPLPPQGSDASASRQRLNDTDTTKIWSPTVQLNGPDGTATTLGTWNGNGADPKFIGVELTDRLNDPAVTFPSGISPLIELNIADLHRYMHAVHTMTGADTVYTLGDGLADPNLYPPDGRSMPPGAGVWKFPQESKVRMDFAADPRAQRVLQLVATIDRASDKADQLGAGVADTAEETRIHGRINVNTAPPEVLLSLPNITPQIVANIICYRDRLYDFSELPKALSDYYTKTLHLPNPTDHFNANHAFPGFGVKTMAELLLPVYLATARNADNIRNRDAAWATLFTTCTTRSDTFVLYCYMEAIPDKDPTKDLYSTDPNTGIPSSQAVAKRRFIAIIDRSNANVPRGDTANAAKFQLPRVLAIKDLPQ